MKIQDMKIQDFQWKYTTFNEKTRLSMKIHDLQWKYRTFNENTRVSMKTQGVR